MATIDLPRLLDEGEWSGYQKLLIAGTALAIVLDGMDNQLLGNAIPALMKSLLTQMAREFPGEDLTIIAYAPTQPPMRLGVARLDARTRRMTYTSDQPTNN